MIRPCLLFRTLALCVPLCLLGCGQSFRTHPIQPSMPACEESQTPISPAPVVIPETNTEVTSCIDPVMVRSSERSRAGCYHLQPARTVVTTKTGQHGGKKKKAPIATKKTGKNRTKAKISPPRKIVRTVGRCQPQSLIYARCRTGINTCRLGDTSPVQWFACAHKNEATSSLPTAGSVIVLDASTRRGMPTGHPAYIEEAEKNSDGTWTLRISHTNYDRKCHLDLDSNVIFSPCTMTASFESGPWSPWAKHLKVLGFIVR
ncbi:MAG: hypothetical protein AB7U29_11965 [Desulfobulbus sp.]